MRKILLLSILLISFTCVKAQYYQLGFDSVRVKSKFKLGTVTTGSATDSVLVKKANGGVYKVARSSFTTQTLSLTSTSGGLSISDGNTVNLASLSMGGSTFSGNSTDASLYALAGLNPFVFSAATGFPTGSGAGVRITRVSTTALGYLEFTISNLSDSIIYVRKGIGASTFSPFMRLVSKSYVDVADALKVPLTRTVSTGYGLSGGGDLSANRTLIADSTVLRTAANSLTLAQLQTKFNLYQTVSNLSTDLTASASKYPSVNAVNTGLALKANLTDLNSFANYTASGDGVTTAITITHGLSGISGTSKVIVQPLNSASAGVMYVTISSTQVTINYTVAPVLGSSNLNYSILIKP